MRIFANIFLFLFFADGGLSLVDGLLALFAPLPLLSALRSSLAGFVVIMAVAVYFCLGIDKRLSKRLLLPLVLFVCCSPLAGWLLQYPAESRGYDLLLAVLQVLLCLLTAFCLKKMAKGSLILPPEMFTGPVFSLRNSLIFGAANLVVIPLALVLLAIGTANSYMAEYAAGFMRVAPDGLHMTERVYRRADKTIRLAAMIHVGEKQYYEELVGAAYSGRTIVLAEGVTDDENLLPDRLDYGKVAGLLGLTSQATMRFRGRVITGGELGRARAKGAGKPAGEADILRADVDLSSFHPETIQFLSELGKQMQAHDSMLKGAMAFNSWAENNMTPQTQELIMADILYGRNKQVISQLGKALERYDTIVIPWGALHMPAIEAAVLARGFKLQQQRERVSINFRRMLTSR